MKNVDNDLNLSVNQRSLVQVQKEELTNQAVTTKNVTAYFLTHIIYRQRV